MFTSVDSYCTTRDVVVRERVVRLAPRRTGPARGVPVRVPSAEHSPTPSRRRGFGRRRHASMHVFRERSTRRGLATVYARGGRRDPSRARFRFRFSSRLLSRRRYLSASSAAMIALRGRPFFPNKPCCRPVQMVSRLAGGGGDGVGVDPVGDHLGVREALRMASFAALNSCPPPSQFCGATVARWMGEGRAGRLRERWDARDERDARRGGAVPAPGRARATRGCTDRRETRGARDDATARRSAARRGAAGTDRARVGAGGRAHMAVRDDERVVGGARGVPRPGGDGRGAARGGSDRRAAARECAARSASVSASERGRGGHRRARARRTCAFGARETPSGSRPRDAVATRPDPRKRTRESPDEPPKAANARKKLFFIGGHPSPIRSPNRRAERNARGFGFPQG